MLHQIPQSSRNASENPAGIETNEAKPEILGGMFGRNASENPAGIETAGILLS